MYCLNSDQIVEDIEDAFGDIPELKMQNCNVTDKMVENTQTRVSFKLNGECHTVDTSYPPTMTLNEYIREVAGLTGTKVMCRSGNCGCCTVSVKYYDATIRRQAVKAIASCLSPLYGCDGWEITTTEGIGSKRRGFHPTQERIADHNGSQCGWCTPGMVMSMYSCLEENPSPTKEEVEKVLDGNICRCTGFRSILNAFQTFSPGAECKDRVIDVEDICKGTKGGKICDGLGPTQSPLQLEFAKAKWYKPTNLKDLLTTVDVHKGRRTRLVGGHTTVGFTPVIPQHDIYIDVKGVQELFQYSVKDTVTFGACVTLTHMIDILKLASLNSGFEYCAVLAKDVKRVASTNIRNVATWAGNLMARHVYHGFVSDIFTIFATVGAKLLIGSSVKEASYTLEEFLDLDMTGKVILSVSLSAMSEVDVVKIYKIMPRGESALAYVNAGFRFNIGAGDMMVTRPTIVYGGINRSLVHAEKTEEFLTGKAFNQTSLKGALLTLVAELEADDGRQYVSGAYRKNLALALFYKFALYVRGDQVAPPFRSGGIDLERPLSTGMASYQTDKSIWPVSQPLPKTSGRIQASGEAVYVPDMKHGELHAAFVLTTVGNAKIQKVDPSPALKIPGVVRYIDASDIPPGGVNNCAGAHGAYPMLEPEMVFCEDRVLYCGQAVGLIVADTHTIAETAAKKVLVEYSEIQRPVTDLREAISRQMFHTNQQPSKIFGQPDEAFQNAHKVIEGEVNLGAQYHLHMETQSCLSVPDEDGFQVYPTTQWPDYAQRMAAQVLGVKETSIRVDVRRLGGGFGGKLTRNTPVSSACVLASYVTQKPVKIHMNLDSNMAMLGKREVNIVKYKVAVDETGRLLAVDLLYYLDCGCSSNDSIAVFIHTWADSAYFCENWRIQTVSVKTNTPMSTFTRAPGSVTAMFVSESIMEHVAHILELDSLEVKFNNLYSPGQVNVMVNEPLPDCPIRVMFNELMESANVEKRKIDITAFNKGNRWRKRGLSVVALKFGAMRLRVCSYNVLLSIYNGDGSVSVSHGGVEIGQGIDTKVIQVCALELGIEPDFIKVRPTDTHSNANSQMTAGSVASESCCLGVVKCCQILKARLQPHREKDLPWPGLIQKAFLQGVDLTAQHWVTPEEGPFFPYNVFGVTCSEVELDVLTGQNQVTRVDMLYDCGKSLNPDIDYGQAHGAFIMGLGLFLLEDIKYNPDTGRSYSNDLWNYLVPTVKDLPIDFRISFLKESMNPEGVHNSKLVGEPPLCMSSSVFFALKNAIASARLDAGEKDFFHLGAPCTVDKAESSCLNDIEQFKL